MDNSQILSIVAIIGSIGSIVISVINHKRIRSNCLGKVVEVSIDIENTSPPKIGIPLITTT
jgi:hypothetical protein